MRGELALDFDWLIEFGGLDKLEGIHNNTRHIMGDSGFERFASFFFVGVFEDIAEFSTAAA